MEAEGVAEWRLKAEALERLLKEKEVLLQQREEQLRGKAELVTSLFESSAEASASQQRVRLWLARPLLAWPGPCEFEAAAFPFRSVPSP